MIALLLSGGVDSTALAYWKRPAIAITIDYGQAAARAEITAAAQVARELGLHHEIVRVDCASLGSGDMAGRAPLTAAPVPEWWPYRNQFLVTVAGMRAITMGVNEIHAGSVASDGSHADGRAEFYFVLDQLMALQEGGIRVKAPAIAMTTTALVRSSGVPRTLLAWAHSCHVGDLACGACRGCVKHFRVMEEIYGEAY